MKAFFHLSNSDFYIMQRSPITANIHSQVFEGSHLFQKVVVQVDSADCLWPGFLQITIVYRLFFFSFFFCIETYRPKDYSSHL